MSLIPLFLILDSEKRAQKRREAQGDDDSGVRLGFFLIAAFAAAYFIDQFAMAEQWHDYVRYTANIAGGLVAGCLAALIAPFVMTVVGLVIAILAIGFIGYVILGIVEMAQADELRVIQASDCPSAMSLPNDRA